MTKRTDFDARQTEDEGLDWLYLFTAGLFLGTILFLAVVGHAWVSHQLT